MKKLKTLEKDLLLKYKELEHINRKRTDIKIDINEIRRDIKIAKDIQVSNGSQRTLLVGNSEIIDTKEESLMEDDRIKDIIFTMCDIPCNYFSYIDIGDIINIAEEVANTKNIKNEKRNIGRHGITIANMRLEGKKFYEIDCILNKNKGWSNGVFRRFINDIGSKIRIFLIEKIELDQK